LAPPRAANRVARRAKIGGFRLITVVFALVALLVSRPAQAQEGVITGVVFNQATGEPMAGVQIVVVGTELGSSTANNGSFRISGVSGEEVTLRVMMLGYRTETQTVRVGENVRIALSSAPIALDQLVVTGTAGGTQARAIGNTVGRVRAEEIVQVAPPLDLQSLLSPQVAGLRFMRASGEVGTGGVTRIRGAGSLSLASEPLVFVDGVRVNNARADGGAAFRDGGMPSRINDFNPDEVESIEVIKGPAAATLYGTEASNGVIQIITKRGRSGEARFDLNVNQGVNFLRDPVHLFQPTYMLDPATGDLIEFNPLSNDLAQGLGSPFSTGHIQGYGLSVRGGAEKFLYYISGEFDRQEGIVSYNWQNKTSTRANFTYLASDRFQIDSRLGFVRSKTRSANVEQPITSSIIWSDPSTRNTDRRGYRFVVPEAAEDLEGYQAVDRVTAGIELRHTPLEWLTQRVTLGTDIGNIRSTAYWPRDSAGVAGPYASNSLGRKDLSHDRSTFLTLDYSATATANFNALQFATSVGSQYYTKSVESSSSRGLVFPVRGVETISATANRFADESFLENKTFGLYVQEQIGWKNRVFVTGAIRGDDNSAFGKNYDFVVYPKLSATWVVSEEPFWDVGFFNSLKLRTAWGKAGQQPDVIAAVRLYSPSIGRQSQPIVEPSNVGNPDLEPEVSRELEAGFDATLLADRASLEFTYYNKTTEGAIVARPALPSSGFPGQQFINVAEVNNKGIELALNAELLNRPNLSWNLGVSMSTNDNKVVDLGGVNPGGGDQRNVEGWPLSNTFMKRVVSAEFDADGDVINILCEGPDPNLPQEIGMIVGGGPPVPCDEAGTADFGQPLPTYEGSVSTTLTLFKNLSLFGLVDFVGGHTRRDGDIAAAHLFFYNSRAMVTRSDPILLAYNEIAGLWQAGMIKGDFAKLRNLSATYIFPTAWASRIGSSRTSLTLSAENVATIWMAQKTVFGRRVVDHEVRAASSDFSNYNQEQFPQSTRLMVILRTAF
jgi:TonB-linked SusC/RagA family outer membrane protein